MARLRQRRALDFWPGFVDALASLLMVLMFVILVFAIGQFVLTDAVSGRDQALARLNAELASLSQSLSLEQGARARSESALGELQATLGAREETQRALEQTLAARERELSDSRARTAAEAEAAARLHTDLAALNALKQQLEEEIARQHGEISRQQDELGASAAALEAESALSARSIAQVELLNRQLAAVREQLTALNDALESSRQQTADKELELEALGKELNLALAGQLRELGQYRSEFFGRLRGVLGKHADIAVVGDRFVFSSEVLFASASDEVSNEGLIQLTRLAETLKVLAADIPAELPWVLQVDGHTDRRPIATERFPSNWELSTARALAIVKFLRSQGVPAQRLAASGYGEFHPLDEADNEAAWARNRRIELKLTSR